MKRNKLFFKLLCCIHMVFTIFSFNCVRATQCENIIKYLSGRFISVRQGLEMRFFDKADAEINGIMPMFGRMMCQKFPTYAVDRFVDVDQADADSIDFLYLILYIYETVSSVVKKDGQAAASSAVCYVRFGLRSTEEQCNDRLILLELSRHRKKMNDLKPLMGIA